MVSHAHAELWASRLRDAGTGGVRGTWLALAAGERASVPDLSARIDGFRDGSGNRRPADGALLSRLLRHDAGALLRRPTAEVLRRNPDAALWWALHDPGLAGACEDIFKGTRGPLFPRLHGAGIEMWTEAELSGLHALTWHALREPALLPRVFSAAAWLIEEVQPDNATQHPWGVHVFALLAENAALGPTANLYAETLLHNALIPTGVAEVFSAVILLDAAEAMEGLAKAAPVKLA